MKIVGYDIDPICFHCYKISRSGLVLERFTSGAFKYLSSSETSFIDNDDLQLPHLSIIE